MTALISILVIVSLTIFFNIRGCKSLYNLINKERISGFSAYVIINPIFFVLIFMLMSVIIFFLTFGVLVRFPHNLLVINLFWISEYLIWFVIIEFLLVIKFSNKKINEDLTVDIKNERSYLNIFKAILYAVFTMFIVFGMPVISLGVGMLSYAS